jgi:hypothetical protein
MTYITQDYRRRRHQSQSLDPQRERERGKERREKEVVLNSRQRKEMQVTRGDDRGSRT